MWERQKQEDETAIPLQECQGKWVAYPKGRLTHRLIRDAKVWTTREHGTLHCWVTQALSVHGCSDYYLFKYKRQRDPSCQNCGAGWDDAEHAFFHCITFMEVRAQLQQKIGTLLETETYCADRKLGRDCVLLQARDHKEERKRSRDAANGEPRTHILEEKGDRQAKLRMSMCVCACVCVRGCACVCP